MEGDLSSVVPQSTSEERDHMADADSKDLDSGRNTPTLANTANDSTNFIQSTIDDLVSTSENDFPTTASISRETSDEVGAVPTEKETVLFVKNSNDLPLFLETNVIDPILSEYTESTPVTQPALSEETETSEGNQPVFSDKYVSLQVTQLMEETVSSEEIKLDISKEIESTQIIQSPISEDIGYIQVNQSALPDESVSSDGIQTSLPDKPESSEEIQTALPTESVYLQVKQLLEEIVSSEVITLDIETEETEMIQLPLSEDIGYVQVNKPALDADPKSTKVKKSTLSRETEMIHTSISEGTSSSTAIQLDLFGSSDEINSNTEISIDSLESTNSRKDRVSEVNETDPSASPEIASKGPTGIEISGLNFLENSSFPPALDSEGFLSLLNTDEYRNATHIVIPGCGQVLSTPTTPCEPIFPNFKMPSLTPPKNDPSLESNIPLMLTKDGVPKRKSSKRSMTTLLSMFVGWVQRGQENLFNSFDQPKIKDFVDNSKKELKYGLDLLNQMDNLVEKLLRGVGGLPDPTSMFPRELGTERISVRDCLMDAAADLQRRIQGLEADVAEDYNTLVSIFCNENLNSEGLENKQLAETAQDIVLNAFVNVARDLLTLGMVVEKYRDKIRDFCLAMDMFL